MARTLSILISVLLFLCCSGSSADKPAVNAEGRYEIGNPAQLVYLSENIGSADTPCDGYYTLVSDLDMSGVENFRPIDGFTGVFDGCFHTISNLTVNYPDKVSVGMFGTLGAETEHAVVKNLRLDNLYVMGSNMVGGVAGTLFGSIHNTAVGGEVDALLHCSGGIAGRLMPMGDGVAPAMISDCISYAAVISLRDSECQGGIAGRILSPEGVVRNCITTSEVGGKHKTGGLVGLIVDGGMLVDCVAANRWISYGPYSSKINPVVGEPAPKAVMSGIEVWNPVNMVLVEGAHNIEQNELLILKTYLQLGWDFENCWVWSGDPGNGYPTLIGFEELDNYMDFGWYADTLNITHSVLSDLDKITLTLVPNCDDVTGYSISMADRGLPREPVWTQSPSMTFDGLQQASAYELCYKVKCGGRESRWHRVTANTGIPVSDDQTPRNVSSVVTADPSCSMTLAWSTMDTTLTNPLVWLSTESDYDKIVSGTTVRGVNYVKAVSNSVDKNLYSAYRNFHRVTVDNLKSSTTYYYVVGDRKGRVVSDVRQFTTAPAGKDSSFEFAYLADTQLGENVKASDALGRMYGFLQEKSPLPAFVYYAGDVTEKGYNNAQMERFHLSAQAVHSKTFCVTALGNHDDPDYLRHYFPTPVLHEKIPFVYSFDYGPAHFMVLNTQLDSEEILDEQIRWMEKDFAANSGKWNIVLFHKALYATTDHVNHKDIDKLRRKLCPVFESLGIDMVLMGHDHCFTRGFVKQGYNAASVPIQDGGNLLYKSPHAPLYMVNGTAGTSKWYKRIRYDTAGLHLVAPDYAFADKSSSTYDAATEQQSFTMVKVKPESITLSTYFIDDKPYLFDQLTLVK